MAPVLVVPGHKYLGPGNKLNSGKPVNSADKIAERHDWFYNLASSESDIRLSDFEAIQNFWKEWKKDASWNNLLGAAGLGLKYAAESVVGVQYPQMNTESSTVKPSNKRARVTTPRNWARIRKINSANRLKKLRLAAEKAGQPSSDREQVLEAPPVTSPQPGPSHRQEPTVPSANDNLFEHFENLDAELDRIGREHDMDESWEGVEEDAEEEMAVDADAVQAGGHAAGGSSGGVNKGKSGLLKMYKVPLTKARRKVFRNNFTWKFWGNSIFDVVTTNTGPPITHDVQRLLSLGYVPWEALPLYLSPIEFMCLQPDARIIKVGIRATIRGFTTSFETNSTLTGIASTHHWIQGIKAVGLNNKYHIQAKKPRYATGSLLVNAANDSNGNDLINILWGTDDQQTVNGGYPTMQKCDRDNPFYTLVDVQTGNATEVKFSNIKNMYGFSGLGRLDMRKDVVDFSAANFVDQVVLSETYHVKDGTIFRSPAACPQVGNGAYQWHTGNVSTGVNLQMAVQVPNNNLKTVVDTHKVNLNCTGNEPRVKALLNSTYDTIIEKTAFHSSVGRNIHNAYVQPSLHLGIMPVYPNSPGYTATTVPVNVCMYVLFETYCEIEETTGNSIYAYGQVRPQIKECSYDGTISLYQYYNAYNPFGMTYHPLTTVSQESNIEKEKGKKKAHPYLMSQMKNVLNQ